MDNNTVPNSNLSGGLHRRFCELEYQIVVQGKSDSETLTSVGALLTHAVADKDLKAAITTLLVFYSVRFETNYFWRFWKEWAKDLPGLVWTRDALNLFLTKNQGEPVPDWLVISICQTISHVSSSPPDSTKLFVARLHEQLPTGFRTGSSNTLTTVSYSAVGPQTAAALQSRPDGWVHRVSDYFVDHSVFSVILSIWRECHGTTATSARNDAAKLPSLLDQHVQAHSAPSNKTQKTSGEFFEDVVIDNSPAVPVAESEELIELPVQERPTKKQEIPCEVVSPAAKEPLVTMASLAEAREKTAAIDSMLREMLGEELVPKKITPLSAELRSSMLDKLCTGQTVPKLVPQLNVGRQGEIETLAGDVSQVASSRSAFRVIVAEPGDGKTSLRDTTSANAVKRGVVVGLVDISACPSARVAGNGFQYLLSSAMTGLQTPGSKGGVGLQELLGLVQTRILPGGMKPSKKASTAEDLETSVMAAAPHLRQFPLGHTLARVIAKFVSAKSCGDTKVENLCLRWLTAGDLLAAERKVLGVAADLASGDLTTFLRLGSALARLAGFKGFLMLIDECSIIVNSEMSHARRANFDSLLGVLNAHGQDQLSGAGLMLFGTEDLIDARRGLLSHEALKTRLVTETSGPTNSGPILRLSRLTPSELAVMLGKVRDLTLTEDLRARIPDEALVAFVNKKLVVVAAREHATPRDLLKPFAACLATLIKIPAWDWREHWRSTKNS